MDILYELYKGKTVICWTLIMSTVIEILYFFVCGHHMHMYMYRSV